MVTPMGSGGLNEEGPRMVTLNGGKTKYHEKYFLKSNLHPKVHYLGEPKNGLF